jgi:uncharacterized protein (DUF697 family)
MMADQDVEKEVTKPAAKEQATSETPETTAQTESSDEAAIEQVVIHTKEEQSQMIVHKYMGWGASAGLLPIPIWDIVAVAGVHVLMLKDIYKLYDVEFSEKKARSVVVLLLGSLSPALLVGVTASTILKVIPGMGSLVGAITLPVLATAATYGVGKIMTNHLESGGTLDDFDIKDVKGKFNEFVQKGKEMTMKKKEKEEKDAAVDAEQTAAV